MGTFTRPSANQADHDPASAVAHASRAGLAFRRVVYGSPYTTAREQGRAWPQTATRPAIGHDAVGTVIREQLPVVRLPFGQHNGFQDFIGAFLARPAITKAVVERLGYQGQLPLDQQPKLMKRFPPWADPTLGAP